MNFTNQSITEQGGPELPTGSVTVPEPPGVEVSDNTSNFGVSELSNRRNTAGKTKWTKQLNRIVIKCYLKSLPSIRGYRKRMLKIWSEIGLFELNEQKLAGQALAIKTNGWISDLEIEEIKREINLESQNNNSIIEQSAQMGDAINNHERNCEQSNTDTDRIPIIDEQPDNNVEERMRHDGFTDDEINVYEMLSKELKKNIQEKQTNLRFIDRRKLKEVTSKVNKIIPYLTKNTLSQCNNIMKASANVVRDLLGIRKKCRQRQISEPWWKRRLTNKINEIRKDLSILQSIKDNLIKNDTKKKKTTSKYNVKQKGLNVVIEELKQRIIAISAKIKRYEGRINQYQQNRMFTNNQKMLFEKLEGKERSNDIIPEREEAKIFWKGIWEKDVNHNEEADWIKVIEDEVHQKSQKQINFEITLETFKKQVKRLSNWKSPGPDGVQGYWIKNLTSLHVSISTYFNDCLESGTVPAWLTTGNTVLIVKDKAKGNDVTNFRPITCLSLLWKLLTGILSEEIYNHLNYNGLLTLEQKGCRQKSRGTKDQLLIDKMILKNCKRRHTGLAMGWIDYKKAFDMIPHSWILKCLDIFNVADNIQTLLRNSMKTWQTELTSGGTSLGNVNIKRGIFQGDSLSPLLFIICLIPMTLILRKVKAGYELGKESLSINHLLFMDDLKVYGKNETELETLLNSVRIFSNDICMEFGINKCGILVMKRGELIKSEGMMIPPDEIIKEIDTEDGYKYLGVLEADTMKEKKMKDILKEEYLRRIRSIMKSKLNSKNVISAINSRAISIIRYSAGIIKWTIKEMKELDRKTRKLLTINSMFHKRGDIDRLYIKRSEGGRGMISVEDCIAIESNSLLNYVRGSNEPMLQAVAGENIMDEGKTKRQVILERKENLKNKNLHSVFFEKTEFRDERSWHWLKHGDLKRATEGMLMAAQEQALRTKSIKHYIDKTEVNPLCRLCGNRDETLAHIISECEILKQRQYKIWRHDAVAKVIHWDLCKMNDLPHSEKWYEHQPTAVTENENVKLLWDFKIQTDKVLEHNKPDILLFNKNTRTCLIVDVACPFDTRVVEREGDKIDRYQDLKWEIKRIWECSNVRVVPLVIGALGTISRSHQGWLDVVSPKVSFGILQKACLLGTARILRYVLNI